MSDADQHSGGCQCGAVRYRTTGAPAKTAVCHCRYCQLRTGSAFGVSVYFPEDAVTLEQGTLTDYAFQTESGRTFTTRFCPRCGTSVLWTIGLFPGMIGVAGGTFDPPSFWYDVKREVFTRSKAPFVELCIADSSETSSAYAPIGPDPAHRNGAR
ncbi:MAG: GFA family protein [Pararhodobacter sp.]